MNHAPTPYDVEISIREFVPRSQGGGEKITLWAGRGESRKRICTFTRHENLSETKANANFIEAACNAHEDLVKALKEIRDAHLDDTNCAAYHIAVETLAKVQS